jgi:hypothetical protein
LEIAECRLQICDLGWGQTDLQSPICDLKSPIDMSDYARLKAALADRYAIEGLSGVGKLTTAQAAARQSVGKPTLAALVASATVSWPSREFTRGTTRRLSQTGADERG